MATKNNRRTLITKKILKESLLELMQEKPVSKITIKEICDLSEMSRSTFYLHYQDQFELLKDIEKEVLEKTFENLRKIDSPMNTMESIEAFLSYVKEHRTTFGILLCQPENELFQQSIISSVQKYVQESAPEIDEIPTARYVYTFIMYGSLNVIKTWIENGFDADIHALAEVIYHSCNNIARSQA
jgi:AcrR family transcriptional regulator